MSDNVIVVGYAKVPAASASRAVHEFMAVTLRVDSETGTVKEVDSTAVTSVVRNWIGALLIGIDFRADIEPIMREIDRNYLGHGGGAIKQAISDAWRRYAAHSAP
jgi:hypothetical protein